MGTNTDKVKDFFAKFSGEGPQERELKVNGATDSVWVRRLTAGEAIQVNAGTVFRFERTGDPTNVQNQRTTSETDLGAQAEKNALLVHFSLCWADGTKMFPNIGEVRKIDGAVFDALVKIASEYNVRGGDEEAGKVSKPSPSSEPS